MPEMIWEGWKLTEVKHAGGGSAARRQRRRRQKRSGQERVLSLIKSSFPEAVFGVIGLDIPQATVNKWVAELASDKALSIYEVRDRINFLALGLERGKRLLNWAVNPPAPISIIHQEKSAFTLESLVALNEQRVVSQKLQSSLSSHGTYYLKNSDLVTDEEKVLQSWGAFLYLAVTVDGVCNMKYLCDIAGNTRNIWITDKLAWIALYEESSDEADEILHSKKQSKPAPWRSLLGAASLDRLLYHINTYGHPPCKEGQDDLSPDFRTMTKMRFPVNLTGWRSQHEEAIQRRTNHQGHQRA